jgi:hypothetical protein
MKNKAKNNTTNNNEIYKIERGIAMSNRPGRKPSRLGNTIRLLNVGDGFTYPYTSGASTFNVRRAAKTCGVELNTTRTGKGIFAVRTA